MGTLALIGLGSNLGDRKAQLDKAVADLAGTPDLSVHSVSSYHETAPTGGPPGQGAFLNAAARLDSDLDPHALLRRLQEVEANAGRVRSVRWGERPLDLDLLMYGCKRLQSPTLILPHPRMAVRRFVLAPLAEIAPDIVDLSTGLSVVQLLANLDRRPSYVAIKGPAGRLRDEVFRQVVEGLTSVGLAESELIDDDPTRTGDAPFPSKLALKLHHLDARIWEKTLGETRWLVTDFCLTHSTVWDEKYKADYIKNLISTESGSEFFLVKCRQMLAPTLIIDLHVGATGSSHAREPLPFRTRDVRLVPETDTAEEIAREVLAACKASRGG